MAALGPYRFEPERAYNPDNSDSDDEEPNDRLGGTFWCNCERCEFMPTEKECVCCREEPKSETEMESIICILCRVVDNYNIASRAVQSNSVYVSVLKIPIVHADDAIYE